MFKFSTREFLLLTTVVALAVAWAVDHYRPINRRLEWRAGAMEEVLEDQGWIIEQQGWTIKIHRKGGNEYEWGVLKLSADDPGVIYSTDDFD
jgi:hypothetical protein